MTATANAIQARRDALMAEINDLLDAVVDNLTLDRNRPETMSQINEMIEDAADKLVHALRLSDVAVAMEELLK